MTMSAPEASGKGQLFFETVNVRQEGAVLFVEISAPPMNLLGPALVRDLVSLIQLTEANDVYQVLVFKSADPDYFISHVDVTRIKEKTQYKSGGPRCVSIVNNPTHLDQGAHMSTIHFKKT